jgi:non-specific serine/threonine protein kinase
LQFQFNLGRNNLRNSINFNLTPEHYIIYKELHKIKGLDISSVNIAEIANLDLSTLQIDITKAKIELENSKLELLKLKKFYENFNVEEKSRESEIRSEIKWFNKTLHNRDLNSIRSTTENLYNDIIENITLINDRVQEDIEDKKMQLHLKTENLFDFTNLKNNNFLKKTLKSQEGMVKILYTFTQEMGKIRGNYENIRKRIQKFNETNFKYNCKIEEESLKMEKIKSGMMKYKIKINKLKMNTKTNDLKKSFKKDRLEKRAQPNKDEIEFNNEEILERNDNFKNILINHSKRIKSAKLNLDNPNKRSNNQEILKKEGEESNKHKPKKVIKFEKNLVDNLNTVRVINNIDKINDGHFQEIHKKDNVLNELERKSPINCFNSPFKNNFVEPIYDDAAFNFINYVFSFSNETDNINNLKNKDIKKSLRALKIDKYLNSNSSEIENKKAFIRLNENKDNENLKSIEFNKTRDNLNKLINSQNLNLQIKEDYQIDLDHNIEMCKNEKVNNDVFLSQKELIVNIIDNNPKIGNTVQHLTNTLSSNRNKLNKVIKEQTEFLFCKNKLQEIVYKLLIKFKKDLKNDDNYTYNNHKNYNLHRDVMKTTNYNSGNFDEINLLDVENIASERRKFIDLIVKDKDILLSFYDDKFPKVNSINKKFNPY